MPDAVVVGSGPNGLAAAIAIAEAGRSVRVYEGAATPGGGMRTQELTLPGFRHDVCSAIHPLLLASPFFRRLPLAAHGLQVVQPDAPYAHPLDDGSAVVVERSVEATASELGSQGAGWRKVFGPLTRDAHVLASELLGPFRPPRHPFKMARFGLQAIRSARAFARSRLDGERAQAAFAGVAAHSMLRLDEPVTAGVGLMLGTFAHAVG
ncbi:MAG TPA: NAD(P)-binding protein, partial [Vitreimonas sp.]|nr:NAD(P)-binding protein [Vitreimonas sp.]